jgi:hypothetical protein
MPQSGPRGSPEADRRHGAPAITRATATLEPDGRRMAFPLTNTSTVSCMLHNEARSFWKIRLKWNLRLASLHQICQQAPGGKRRCDT